jgi:hypothetical protein
MYPSSKVFEDRGSRMTAAEAQKTYQLQLVVLERPAHRRWSFDFWEGKTVAWGWEHESGSGLGMQYYGKSFWVVWGKDGEGGDATLMAGTGWFFGKAGERNMCRLRSCFGNAEDVCDIGRKRG